ncbi:Methylmalonyl-CoA carboxyltransferase 5S subunit [Weissella viridescens]|uniref:Methylmalonyl-CoA carboxyltransferase 5S subunit n=1 Tax=Weissella viridescens TaxID=1629 RepID=A0A380P371_WEIVI|nr:Methylmalonyl-CoA carboxyltransferase 5S subunit [Weissella viridescens]
MSGLLKPEAAYQLVSTLKNEIDLPIHLHTHDTTGIGVSTYARAVEAGVDIIDVAQSAMASTTSQPSLSSTYYALSGNDRQPTLDMPAVERLNQYWQGVVPYYQDLKMVCAVHKLIF